jgi:hypothetical protein
MREGRGKGGIAAALVGLAALLCASSLAPSGAAALDSDLKHAATFRLKASNGYEILAFAASEHADGRGEIWLIVVRRNAAAFYLAPAKLTATSVEADLGRLGEISLEVVPSGRTKRVRSRCEGEEPVTLSFEPESYRGIFEFHGEEGFTEATSTSPREATRLSLGLICGSVSGGETSGAMFPGARLRLRSHRGSFRLDLQANKNRPGARTRFEVETHEKRQGIAIRRHRTVWAGAGAFGYDRPLNTATLAPPAPFSGHAEFHRHSAPANRWTGNLTVDLPGRSDVPLTGAGVGASLVHACWGEGEGLLDC